MKPRARLVALLLILATLAALNSFIQDDAFISFRYAKNLVQGHGLTWNPGERVEGYTNFLWTVLMAVPIAFGRDPVFASQALGLICFVGSLLVAHRLARNVLGSAGAADLTVALLGTNYTFSAYATGGLETQLQTLLVAACTLLAHLSIQDPAHGRTHLMWLSVLTALALLTRLDSAVPLSLLLVLVLWRRRGIARGTSLGDAAALLGPLVLSLGPWLAWKYAYYGSVLPNSFQAKLGHVSATTLWMGVLYQYEFLQSYLLVFPVLLGLVRWKSVVRSAGAWLLVGVVGLWCLYVIAVGGDYMEFRFLVTVLPLAFVLLVAVICSVDDRKMRAALVLLVVLGSLRHALFFGGVRWIESVPSLEAKLRSDEDDWIGIGKRLGELFGGREADVVIATTAAGAIPYYSGLRTIDMLGVNDPWVARHGIVVGPKPGHRRMATLDYLLERGVHLVLGHPQVESSDDRIQRNDLSRFGLGHGPAANLSGDVSILEIPLERGRRLLVLYLRRSPVIDDVIRRTGLRTLAPDA